MTTDDRPRAALVVNPVKADAPKLVTLLRAISTRAGWADPLILETSVEDPGQDATRTALDSGAAAVLVAGGDGTVRAVSEAMSGSEVPLSIVPSGTGNLLARNLGLALDDPGAAIAAAVVGDRTPVDIGWAELTRADGTVDRHAFVVLAGIGLDAHMIANTRPGLKKSVGWVAYVDGAARALPGAKPFRIMYAVDDERLHSVKVHSVLFANCGALPAGIALVPDASITDGLLDVAVIQARGAFGWLAVWRTVWWQNSVLRRTKAGRRVIELTGSDNSIRYLSGRDADAATTEPAPVELDGDEFGEAVRIRCRIDAGALLMAVPAGHVISPA
ncbi:MAG: NAD(+)/NADH kinase [Actinobacteria bacterium]|nr:NAD(+)/NADH kinase [Actinomycetota bacterium]